MKWKILALLALIPIAVGCGSKGSEETATNETATSSESAGEAAGEAAPAQATPAETPATQPAAQPAPKPVTFVENKARLVDAAEAKKNPKVIEVTNRINASDPLTASYKAYFSLGARAEILNFKRNLDIKKQFNDGKWPSFEEFSKMATQMRIDFVPVLPWQMVGYDQTTGALILLEDKGEKIRRYKAKDIPLDEEDKPYDTE